MIFSADYRLQIFFLVVSLIVTNVICISFETSKNKPGYLIWFREHLILRSADVSRHPDTAELNDVHRVFLTDDLAYAEMSKVWNARCDKWAAPCFIFYGPTTVLQLCDLKSSWQASGRDCQKALSLLLVCVAVSWLGAEALIRHESSSGGVKRSSNSSLHNSFLLVIYRFKGCFELAEAINAYKKNLINMHIWLVATEEIVKALFWHVMIRKQTFFCWEQFQHEMKISQSNRTVPLPSMCELSCCITLCKYIACH